MKKKTLVLTLVLALMLGIVTGCKSKEEEKTSKSDANVTATETPVTTTTPDPVTEAPTEEPTEIPTEAVTEAPTEEPTEEPTEVPNETPVETEVFAGGSGTVEDPWQIATAEQLDCVREDLKAHYVLVNDIDLSGIANWTPIGAFQSLSDAPEDAEVPHPDYAFTGTFDGAGHTISNLTIVGETPMGVGLFGCATGTENGAAYIGNFTLENVNASGFYLVGSAVGLQFMNCPVSNIKLIGDNKLSGMQGIGGLVGTGFDLISDCSATADITVMGDDGACAGIIAGGTTMSSIKNCEVIGGSITAEGNATWGFGSLCGAPWGAAEITDCKVSGTVITVTGENNRLVGGLVGFGGTYDPTSPAQITGCSVEDVTITVSATTDSVGGLIGAGKEMMEGSDVMSSFIISNCSVSGNIIGGVGNVDAVVGDPTCAVSVECEGGMIIIDELDEAA
ncbi:MAG: hypothetical protein IKP88_09780 [Lachnospiraceae bacterium]|nr:hypothetical protein [Lachnospiraceae bacterium]